MPQTAVGLDFPMSGASTHHSKLLLHNIDKNYLLQIAALNLVSEIEI